MRLARPVLFASLFALAACSSSATDDPSSTTTFPAAAYASGVSGSGQYAVEARTSPQPPARGTIAVELTVTDASTKAPVDGLDLSVRPWMPAMGHGTNTTPKIAAQGGGRYLVTDVELFMAGTWQLDVTLAKTGAEEDHAAIDLDIP